MKKTQVSKLKMIVEKTDTGFSAFAEDLPIYTTAKTIPELLNNSYEAARLYFENEDVNLKKESINYEIDFRQFFQYFRVLNSKFLAERIHMNPTLLSQYIQGSKKPSVHQTEKIIKGIHDIGKELLEIELIYK